jgi:hypothetical protein
MSLVSYSQKFSSITPTDCVVPCKALKNALIMKEDFESLKNQYQIKNDSIVLLQQIVTKKDELITNKDKEISLMKSNEVAYKEIIKEKDKQISEYQRKYKIGKVKQYAGMGFGLVAAIVGVVIGL